MEEEGRAIPRNGSGTYSTPNSFTTGAVISSSGVNGNFSDVGAELTNSLPRDGQSGMTGQFKAASGTAAAPGITFGSDTDSGLFLKSANVIGVSVGGTEVGTISGTGFSSFDAGTTALFVQTAAPTGWTKSTTHNNKALRVVSGTASSGGTTAFTSVFTSRTISEANMPSHTHAFSATTGTESNDHTHSYNDLYNPGSTGTTGGGSISQTMTDVGRTTTGRSASHTHNVSGTTNNTGSGTPMDFAVQYVDVIIAQKD